MQGKDKKISHEGEYRASGLVHRSPGKVQVGSLGGSSYSFQTVLSFGPGVTDKGFISFAAGKCRSAGERLEAAKVMKPFGELNGGVRPGL